MVEKCKLCEEPSVIFISHQDRFLCKKHFVEYFENKFYKKIRQQGLLKRKIIVAVSGGKDSQTLWWLLSRYKIVEGLYIRLGLGEYEERVVEFLKEFAYKNSFPIKIYSFPEKFGVTVPELAKRRGQTLCSVCGKVKRYLLNRVPLEEGYDVLLTGHNLDDEVTSIMLDVLRWDLKALGKKGGDFLPKGSGFVGRAKPLAGFTDFEVELFAKIKKVPYVIEKCPHGVYTTRSDLKHLFDELEKRHPSLKRNFYKSFMMVRRHFKPFLETKPLGKCEVCGMPTRIKICSFCRLLGLGSDKNDSSVNFV